MVKHPPLTAKSIIASTEQFIRWIGKERLEQQIDKMIKQEVAKLQAEIETLKMCAQAGEAMGVEMLKLETKNEQLVTDIKMVRSALKTLQLAKRIKDTDGKTPEYISCRDCGWDACDTALALTDKPEYKDES